MSRRFPVCSASDVIKVLRRHGFALAGQAGSHQKWRHMNRRHVIVAVHGSKAIPVGTLKSIIDGSGIDGLFLVSWLRNSFPQSAAIRESRIAFLRSQGVVLLQP